MQGESLGMSFLWNMLKILRGVGDVIYPFRPFQTAQPKEVWLEDLEDWPLTKCLQRLSHACLRKTRSNGETANGSLKQLPLDPKTMKNAGF